MRVTVPVLLTPPITVGGLRLTETGTSVAACKVSVRLVARPFTEAVIDTFLLVPNGWVVIVKFTDVLPAGMFTVAGTVAAGSELLGIRVRLPGAAGDSNVTVPMEV